MNKRVSERQILEQSMKSHQEAIDEAKAKLAELDKPARLRHGEKAVRISGNEPRVVLYNDEGRLVVFDEKGDEQYATPNTKVYRGSGETIFDDLKRYSEDLTEFTMEDDNGDKMAFEIDMAVISLDFEELLNDLTFDKALEMGQKLIRMAYTLKRKNAE